MKETESAQAKKKFQSSKQKFTGFSREQLFGNNLQNYFSQYISKGLKSKLEANFSDFKENPENPLVITLLKYREEGEQIFLAAKDPNAQIFYGIIEGNSVQKKEIKAIPLSQIAVLEFKEESINPFRAKKYIEDGIKSLY